MAGNIKQAAKNKASQTAKNMAPQEAQQVAQGVKDAASAVKNIYAGNKVQGVKDAFSALKNKEFRKWLIIISLAGLLIPILLAGSFISVLNAIPNAVTKLVSSVTSDITKSWNDPVDGKMTIEIDKDKYKQLKESLGAQAIDAKAASLTDECIKIFLLAEYATQYPVDVEIKIEVPTDDEKKIINEIGMSKFLDGNYIKTTGCVELYRPEFAGSNKLEITDLKTLEKYEKEEGDISFDDVKNKYALDKFGNIIIAQRDTKKVIEGEDELNPTATEVNLYPEDYDKKFDWESFNKRKPEIEDEIRSTQKLAYKNEIAMYGMPFEFLSELTSFTGCTEYGLKVASLVTDKTKVKINILDDSKTTETRETEAYDRVHDVDFTVGAKMKLIYKGGGTWGRNDQGIDYRDKKFYKEKNDEFWEEQLVWNNDREYFDHLSSPKPFIHEKRKNTIETQYTTRLQVVEGESWLLKKKSECKAEKTTLEKDNSLNPNPNVVKKGDKNFLNWEVPYVQYKSSKELYDNETTFKEYLEMYNTDLGNKGNSMNEFIYQLKTKYGDNEMLKFAKEYSEYDTYKYFVEDFLKLTYNPNPEQKVGDLIRPDQPILKIMYSNVVSSMFAYRELSDDWKVNKSSYDYLPMKIQVTGKNVQERTAVYKSERKYKVTNVGKVEPNVDEFIKLLVKKTGENKEYVYYKTPHGDHAPIADFITGAEMFFKIIADNDKTANLENAMRYIMNKITGVDYGITEFNYKVYGQLKPVKKYSGSTVQEKVWYALRMAGYSEYAAAGIIGNMYAESGFNPAIVEEGNGIGFGLCQWSFERRTQLENYAKSKGVDPSDVDTQIEFLLTEINPEGGPASGYASFIGTEGIYGCDMEGWLNATSVGEATKNFCGWFERPAAEYFYEEDEINIRINMAKNTYNSLQGKDLKSFSGSGALSGVIDYAMSNMGKTGSDMGVSFAWCAWYVQQCFSHEGYDASSFFDGYTVSTRAALEYASQGKFKKREEGYVPQCGDVILYGSEGSLQHTGMVVDSDGVQVHTIEGNTFDGIVGEHYYDLNNTYIYGYFLSSEIF